MTAVPGGPASGRLVSVVIPCFNSRAFVGEAIASAFGQTHRPLEVIVVDDGSSDGSWELLQELRDGPFPELIVLCHPERVNRGVSTSRALGVAQARGEFVALLDADDVFQPTKLEQQVAALAACPEAVLCHTGVTVIGDVSRQAMFDYIFNRGPVGGPYHFQRQADYLSRHGICNSSVLARRAALRAIPLPIHQIYQLEDWLCWCLLAELGPFLFLPAPLLAYRVHAAAATELMLNSRLDRLYGMLEFKLALLARCASTRHALRVLLSLGETLRQLLVEYLLDPGAATPGEPARPERRNGVMLAILATGKAARLLRRRRPAG